MTRLLEGATGIEQVDVDQEGNGKKPPHLLAFSFGNDSIWITKESDMNSQIIGLRVASVVFGPISLAQLARLFIRPQILVAGFEMPLWPSVIVFVFLGGLSLWMWKLAHTSTK